MAALPAGIPDEAVPFLQEVGYFQPDTLRPGDALPDLPLYTPDGDEIRLSAWTGRQPLVLIFGSYT